MPPVVRKGKGGNFLNKIDEAMPKEGVAKDIYDGSASFGKIIATISLIGACIIGALLFIAGIYVALLPEDPNKAAKDARDGVTTMSTQSAGLIMIVISILMVVAASIYYYLVHTYKAVAALAGVDGALDVVDIFA